MQLGYDRQPDNLAGSWDGDDNHFVPCVNGEDELPIGVFVAKDFAKGDRGIGPLGNASTHADLAGVTAFVGYDPHGVSAPNVIPANSTVSVLDRGLIRVPCVGTVTPEDRVYVIRNPDTGQVRGAIRATPDGARTIEIRRGAQVVRGATNGVALVKIDVLNMLPGIALDS